MSAPLPVISNAEIKMTLQPSLVDPLTDTINGNLPLTYSGQTFIKSLSGVYTPANNFITIYSSSIVPNLLYFVCDALTILQIQANGQGPLLNDMPVKRACLLSLKDISNSGGPFIISLIGQNTTPFGPAMAQGVAVNWALFLADGDVS